MDLTPPLSRSSASPPNSYCPSEIDSIDYHSPAIAAQPCELSSLLGSQDSACSAVPRLKQGGSLQTPDNMSQQWNPPPGHVPVTSVAMPTAATTEYDAFSSYEASLTSSYDHDIYATAHQQPQKATSLAGTPSPGIPNPRVPVVPSSRSPLFFPSPTLTPPRSTRGRGTLEAPIPGYSRGVEASSYALPRPIQSPYPVEPTGVYGPGRDSSVQGGYLSDNLSSVWGQAIPGPASGPEPVPDQLFPAVGGGSQQQPVGLMSDRPPRSGSRTRRPPRRLTTKEEANFQCQVKGCGKLFSRSYNYKAHMETHDEKREYPFPCQVPNCNKKFVRKTDLQRHHQSVHAKERNHKCDYCGRLFARKDTLRRHMDDGCSRRFDIGTLDLRTEGYDSLDGTTQDGLWRVR